MDRTKKIAIQYAKSIESDVGLESITVRYDYTTSSERVKTEFIFLTPSTKTLCITFDINKPLQQKNCLYVDHQTSALMREKSLQEVEKQSITPENALNIALDQARLLGYSTENLIYADTILRKLYQSPKPLYWSVVLQPVSQSPSNKRMLVHFNIDALTGVLLEHTEEHF